MNRIPTIDPTTATGQTAQLLGAVKAKLGVVPNLMRTFAQSPAALEAYLGFGATLAKGVLPAAVREQLALTIAEANGCDYCLSAHSLIGKGAGLTPDAIEAARRGAAADPKVGALLQFAQAVVAARGQVSDETLATVRAAGATDAEIVEVVSHVAANVLTNYLNNVARTTIDFPRAKPLAVVAA
ncbi:MAG TPA: carboxymuconolactone decarboxylase family protein [Lacunisphaera sp.]